MRRSETAEELSERRARELRSEQKTLAALQVGGRVAGRVGGLVSRQVDR